MSRPFVRHAGYLVQPLPDTTPEGLAGFHFILKRSYDLDPGGALHPRERQRVLNLADVYREPAAASRSALEHGSDLTPPKPRCDFILRGHCHPPGGEATQCTVTLRAGDVRKDVLVLGDRAAWLPRGARKARVSKPRPFHAMPLGWERAYGGVADYSAGELPHAGNPAGVGLWVADGPDEPPKDRWGPLPNLETPAAPLQVDALVIEPKALDRAPAPTGVGWVAPHWWPRRRHAGHDPRFRAVFDRMTAGRPPGLPAQPFPERDPAYFNSAPADQTFPLPVGGERMSVRHVHPEHEELTFRLPAVTPALRWSMGRTWWPVPLQLDTVVLDADRLLVELSWRGTGPVHQRMTLLDVPKLLFEVDGEPTLPAPLVDRGFPMSLIYPELFEP